LASASRFGARVTTGTILRRQRSTLSLIPDLLTSSKEESSQAKETPHEESSTELQASFVADVRKYKIAASTPEIPTVIERRPKERFKIVSEDESNTRQPISSHCSPKQITVNQRDPFEKSYRAYLQKELKSFEHIKHIKMRSHVQILTTPSADTPGKPRSQ
jgi:hypothetical protein